MSAPFDDAAPAPAYRTAPDTLDAIRADLDGLLSRPPVVPQTALSDGYGPALHDFADVVDVASLAHARRRHMRRQAMDAVDHLIALLDALDAGTEDCEPDDDADPVEIHGEGDPLEDAEDDDPAEDGGDREPSLGARNPQFGRGEFQQLSQVGWGGFASDDMDREHDVSDAEPYLSVVEFNGQGDNWWRSGNFTMGRNWTDVEDCADPSEEDFRRHAPRVAEYERSALFAAV